MSNENELLEPLATEAGQQAIARAINNLSSLEYAVRAERAATTATQKADEALNSANDASDYATEARNWATKTDGYVDQETITIPPEQEGDEPTTETIDLYSARYYAALAQDIYNNLQFDTEPTENSTALVSSGAIYTALNGKADKSDTYTKTEVDTALGNVQSTLTFDSTPTANSNNPVTSGGVYTALQNVNIDIDDEITEDSDNPVTSAAIYEALQNFTPSGGGEGSLATFPSIDTNNLIQTILNSYDSWTTTGSTEDSLATYTATENCYVCGSISLSFDGNISGSTPIWERGVVFKVNGVTINQYYMNFSSSVSMPVLLPLKKGDVLTVSSTKQYTQWKGKLNVYGVKNNELLLSEQMYSNVLYFNNSAVTTGTITLNDSFNNYDFLEIVLGWTGQTYDSTTKQEIMSSFISIEQIKSRNKFSISDWNDRILYLTFDLTNYNSVALSKSGNTGLYKIIGHKMAKGGYSGIVSDARMTVKSGNIDVPFNFTNNNRRQEVNIVFDSPMPDTNYQAFVGFSRENSNYYADYIGDMRTWIYGKTVNGFILVIYNDGNLNGTGEFDWIAIRPNSYTREGMVEDVLFSNASGVSSGTINLSGNISDYDLLFFDVRASDDRRSRISFDLLSSFLIERLQNNQRVVFVRYDQEYIDFYVTGDNIISINTNNDSKLEKITGIKFGRYVSGVAVDTTVTQNSDAVVTSGAVYDALQNYTPSGGGSSITVDSTITQGGTNPVEGGAIYTALGDKADKSTTYTKTEVDTAVASKGDVTTNTDQNITGTKTFVGSKKVGFKQSAANDKLGFTLFGNTGTERGYLEFNPTNTIDGVAGLMTLGNYATSAAGLTQVGFRRYSNISGASGAYNLLMPMIADAKAPFSLTTSYQNFYLPLGFTDGTTTVKTAKSGVVDLSPLLASLEARIAALEGN